MVGVLSAQKRETRAVEVDTVEMTVIGVSLRILSPGREVQLAPPLVDMDDISDQPRTLGDLMHELSGLSVVQIEMPPSVAFREPDDLGTVAQYTDVGTGTEQRVELDVGGSALFNDGPRLPGGGIGHAKLNRLVAPSAMNEVDALPVFAPPHISRVDRGAEH